MANADTPIPKFKTYAEGEPIPSVHPEDLKRTWEYDRTHSQVGSNGCQWLQDRRAVCSLRADVDDVSTRSSMIETLTRYNRGQLLTPWQHGEELNDAVFRIAATFPLRYLKHRSYKISGDELFGFDPNAFVQQLVEETGIPHTWEPIRTKIGEGGRCFSLCVLDSEDPNRQAKHQARELLWMIFKRFSPILDLVISRDDGENAAHNAAVLFAEFLMDNMDLVRQLEDSFRDMQHIPMDPILSELERRAQGTV